MLKELYLYISSNRLKMLQYLFLWLVYAVVQALVLIPLLSIPSGLLWVDSLTHALLFALIGLALRSVFQFANFEALPLYNRIVNQIALAMLSLSVWLCGGYFLFVGIFGSEYNALLLPYMPLRGLTGVLLYMIVFSHFRYTSASVPPVAGSQPEDTIQEKHQIAESIERISVRSGSKIHVIMVADICYLQADGDYVQIFTMDGKFLKEQTMKYFDEHLPANRFVRVHRSYIVNTEMISRIELHEKQTQLLTLKNGRQVKASQAGYKALRGVLNL